MTQPNVPLRYTDHYVRDSPWWRSRRECVVDPDPNPLPIFGWRWLLGFKRRRRA